MGSVSPAGDYLGDRALPADSVEASRRIVVVGVSGSGKTSLAAALAHRLGIPHVELDSLFWEPAWREAELDEFRRGVDQATAGPAWVVDGNYQRSRDIVWPRADTLIWLDYPLPLALWRLLQRETRRILTRSSSGMEIRHRCGTSSVRTRSMSGQSANIASIA